MRLKQVRLAGFKSFVDLTKVDFPSALTAIVGPNGCGKSNIIDAVRWVLGEGSAKNLRGLAMTDVIFNGASGRSAANRAMVELIFDNKEHKLGGAYSSYTDIAVRRELLSDGSNHYYLNGQQCRKRDISDIFLGTGLGPRSYAIIEQGMISRLIESKPAELRVLIEEAAGVSKYKERRRETQSRIESTQSNMQRLFDIETALNGQIESLESQAGSALSYRKLRQELRELMQLQYFQTRNQDLASAEHLLAQIQGLEYGISEDKQAILLRDNKLQIENLDLEREYDKQQQFQQEQHQLEAQYANLKQSVAIAQQAYEQKKAQIENHQQALISNEQLLKTAYGQRSEVISSLEWAQQLHLESQSALAQLNQKYSAADTRYQQLNIQFEKQQHLVLKQLEDTQNLEREQGQNQKTLVSYQKQLSAITLVPPDMLKAETSKLNELRELLKDNELELSRLQELKQETHHCISATEERISAQQLLCQNLELDSKEFELKLVQVKQQLESCESALSKESLARLIEVNPPWGTAFEQVHSRWLSVNVVTQFNDKIQSLIVGGQSQERSSGHSEQLDQLDSLASQCQPRELALFAEHVLLCESLEQAQSLRQYLLAHESLITPEGYWIAQSWQLMHLPQQRLNLAEVQALWDSQQQQLEASRDALNSAYGTLSQEQTHLAGIKQRVGELDQELRHAGQTKHQRELELQSLASKIDALNQQHVSASQQQQFLLSQIQAAQANSSDIVMRLDHIKQSTFNDDENKALDAQVKLQKKQMDALLSDKNSAIELASQLQQQLHQQQLSKAGLDAQIKQRKQSIELERSKLETQQNASTGRPDELSQLRAQKLKQKLEALSHQLSVSQEQRRDRITLINQIQQQSKTQQKKVDKQFKQLHSLELKQEAVKTRLSALERQYKQNSELQQLPAPSAAKLLENHDFELEINNLNGQIENLGPVNLAAQQELSEKSAQLELMIDQRRDLDTSLEQLASAIALIDKQSRQQFDETFELINRHIAVLFPQVFGGGKAYLQRCSSHADDNDLEQGIRIMAQPPGKKNSNIMALSGGEKALTALALVFAIFELNPAPFCMLDEVDAPLDEVNVGRFAKMVEQMSKRVQFVMITHNKQSMEKSTQLLGVTMHEAGVSRIVSVDVEQAVAWLE